METTRDCYDRPIWRVGRLLSAVRQMPGHLLRVLPTLADRVLSNELRERIMLAVAAANRCRYCKAAHSAFGRLAGMTDDEVRSVLQGSDDGSPDGERLALRYARDLAERDFESRDEVLYERLSAFFTDRQRAAIESTAHVMNFANRFGNTFDAALVRMTGGCEETGADWLDLGAGSAAFMSAAAFAAPFIGVLMLVQKLRPPAEWKRPGETGAANTTIQ